VKDPATPGRSARRAAEAEKEEALKKEEEAKRKEVMRNREEALKKEEVEDNNAISFQSILKTKTPLRWSKRYGLLEKMIELKRAGNEIESLDAEQELAMQPEDGVDMLAWGTVWQALPLQGQGSHVRVVDLQREFQKAIIHDERSLNNMGWDIKLIKKNLESLSGMPQAAKFNFENFWALVNTGR